MMLFALACLPAATLAAGDPETLVTAIRNGDYAGVDRLLGTRGTDPNALLADGGTALSWAVEVQDPRLVRRLLKARARPDAARNDGAAPLLLACEHGNGEIVSMLIDAGANVRRSRKDGVMPLALCAGAAPASMVERLVLRGAVVDAPGPGGQTALMWAAARGRVDNLRVLLTHGADVNRVTQHGLTPLFFALKSGNPQAPVAVLEAGGDPHHVGPEGTTAVQLAMYQHDYAFAARLIDGGVDLAALDRNGHTLLQAATIADQPALVEKLLAAGADPNARTGASRVEWRYEANFRSGDVVLPPKTPLLLAAESASAEEVRLLARAGADPRYRLPDGTSLLHAAASAARKPGGAATLAAALELLPEPNLTDAQGRTALHVLLGTDAGPETADALRLLAAKGARTDVKNDKGLTPAAMVLDPESTAPAVRSAYEAAFGTNAATAAGKPGIVSRRSDP